jgi:hypothetical protein
LYLLEDVIGEMRDVTGKSRAEDMTAKDMTGEKGMTITGANDTRSEDNNPESGQAIRSKCLLGTSEHTTDRPPLWNFYPKGTFIAIGGNGRILT